MALPCHAILEGDTSFNGTGLSSLYFVHLMGTNHRLLLTTLWSLDATNLHTCGYF